MSNSSSKSVIPRATDIPKNFRPKNEAEYAAMGHRIHTNNSWYNNIYDYYQSNEV